MSNHPSSTSCNLIHQPWVLVLRHDGAHEEVSLREVFARAPEFRQLVGELPTQAFALLRLLLAILHRAVEGPETVRQWADLWHAGELPTDAVDVYLDRFRDRFDLLSPDQPFYQVPDLRTAKDTVSGLDRLIADVPVNTLYLTMRLHEGMARIGFAEAARWLVHCQAYDPAGIKSGPVDDPRAKAGKGYPLGIGWAGNLGGVLVEGRDLRETLLLNLVPRDQFSHQVSAAHDDLPAWERPGHEPGARDIDFPYERGDMFPTGPVDLYTWQSRRVRLVHDGAAVHGVVLAYGDKLAPHNLHTHEPMSVWRRSKPQERKIKNASQVYLPRVHLPGKAVWRGLGSLLPGATSARQRRDDEKDLAPGVLEWLATASRRAGLEHSYRLRTRAVGVEYGSQQAVIDDIFDDGVMLAVALLSEDDPELAELAVMAAEEAEHGAEALAQLAVDVAAAAGGGAEGPRARAHESAYAALDPQFREWLGGLGPETDLDVARGQWHHAARTTVEGLGQELIAQTGPAAWRGRTVRRGHKKEEVLVDSSRAYLWFQGRLTRIYGAPERAEATA